ncbi:unnamed protein product [Aphanomyces euteiches]
MLQFVIASLLLPYVQVAAHGKLIDPIPTFLHPNEDTTSYCGTIDGPLAFPGDEYNQNPYANTEAFARHFNNSNFPNLKAFLDYFSTCDECGITAKDGVPQPLPADGLVKWSLGQQGFVSSHEGPCELWCDDNRVFYDINCARNISSGYIPINTIECAEAKMLVFLWLALHTPEWQVYKNCVVLGNSSTTAAPQAATPRPLPTTLPPQTSTSSSHSSDTHVATWQQCGGFGYVGPDDCVTGSICQPLNPYYSQCLPAPPAPNQLDTYQQCGGLEYTGLVECKDGDTCIEINPWYSQCLPMIVYF